MQGPTVYLNQCVSDTLFPTGVTYHYGGCLENRGRFLIEIFSRREISGRHALGRRR